MSGRWTVLFALVCVVSAQGVSNRDIGNAIRYLKATHVEHRVRGANTLKRAGPRAKRAVKPLVNAYADPDEKLRGAIVAALRAIGPAGATSLVSSLRHKNQDARRLCAQLLVEFSKGEGPVPVSPKRLVSSLRSEDPVVRSRLVEVLARCGEPALDPLFAMLDDAKPWARDGAARALASFGAAVGPRLLPLARSDDPRLVHGALIALGAMDGAPAGTDKVLIAAARHAHADVRAAAIGILGRRQPEPKRVLPLLVAALADPERAVVAAAIAALRQWPGDAAVAQLIRTLGDPKQAAAASEALVAHGERAVDPLLAAFASATSAPERIAAADCLGRISEQHGFSTIGDALQKGLKDEDAGVREACAGALLHSAELAALARAPLLEATRDEAGGVRAAALLTLVARSFDDKGAQAAMRRATRDADPVVRAIGELGVVAIDGTPAAMIVKLRDTVANAALPPLLRAQSASLLALSGRYAEGTVSTLVDAMSGRKNPEELRVAATRALGIVVAGCGAGLGAHRKGHYAKLDRASVAAVEAGLGWLASVQSTKAKGGDGRWDCDGAALGRGRGGWAQFDVGVTALTLLTFLAAGYTDDEKHKYTETIHEGFLYLLSRLRKDGLFLSEAGGHDHYLLEHALATQALCERYALTGDLSFWSLTQKAVDVCAAARNPEMAWRYKPRGGVNDTNMTAWMMTTLRVADKVGFKVSRRAYEGAVAWVDKMTDPNFGQVGYNFPGGAPFRDGRVADRFPPEKSQAMTAAGLWIRLLHGEEYRRSPIMKKGAQLCIETPPVWNEKDGSIDMYYWYYASHVFFQVGGVQWRKWKAELLPALLRGQRRTGDWSPRGAWGMQGGAIYQTAIATLTLLSPVRYPVDFADDRLPEPYRGAVEALQREAKGKGRIGDAASTALERIGG